VTAASCDGAACLYIGDIGDNDRRRKTVAIYRVKQPPMNAAAGTGSDADVFTATYPDAAHDAEGMFAVRDGRLFVVTKEPGEAHIYQAPPFVPGGQGQLARVASIDLGGKRDRERITDADASPDGTWVALRSNDTLFLYRTSELLGGAKPTPMRVDLRPLGEPQGEGVTFGDNGTLYLVGEGGGKGRAGTFAALRCQLP
jgi:hypothetical protein